MIEKIGEGIWKVKCDSNVYYIEDRKMIIDTGRRSNGHLLKTYLGKVVDFSTIEVVVFTHIHHDHVGNFDMFPNAKFYASAEEIEDFKKDKSILRDPGIEEKFNVDLIPLGEDIRGVKVIKTPGHTRGSICLLYDEVLFSGDTLLKGGFGRTDMKNSCSNSVQSTMIELLKYKYTVLAPGHEY